MESKSATNPSPLPPIPLFIVAALTHIQRRLVAATFFPSSPPLPLSRRGRKLCRWRRKALINTTVSDRYADPRHCKMAAISPSHSSDRRTRPLVLSSPSSSSLPLSLPPPRPPIVHWTPLEGVSASRSPSPSSLSSPARAPDFHTPGRGDGTPHQVERVEARAPFLGQSNASAPGRTTRYTYIYTCRDFIGRSPIRVLEEPHEATHTPSARVVAVVIIA